MCWPTPSSAPASSRSSPASRARRTSAGVRREIRLPRRRELRGDPRRTARSRRIINTTPNNVHLETTRQAAEAGKHVFLDKPIANTVREGLRDRRGLQEGRRRAGARLPAPPREPFPLDQVRDRRGPLRQAGAGRMQHQPRPARPVRPLLVALHGGGHARRRHAADRHPLRRRAGIPDGAGQERVGAAGSARAARRQPGRRQHDLAAREQRSFQPHCFLCVGFRVLHDEHLRQGGERLLRPVLRPAGT